MRVFMGIGIYCYYLTLIRDLNSTNIMIDKHGDVKIAGYGLNPSVPANGSGYNGKFMVNFLFYK